MFKSQTTLKSMADIEKERKKKMKKSHTNDKEPTVVKGNKSVHVFYIGVIVMIAVAIGSFIAGINYEKQMNAEKNAAVQTALKANTPQNNK